MYIKLKVLVDQSTVTHFDLAQTSFYFPAFCRNSCGQRQTRHRVGNCLPVAQYIYIYIYIHYKKSSELPLRRYILLQKRQQDTFFGAIQPLFDSFGPQSDLHVNGDINQVRRRNNQVCFNCTAGHHGLFAQRNKRFVEKNQMKLPKFA